MKIGGRPGAPWLCVQRYESSPGFFVCSNTGPLSWIVSSGRGHRWRVGFWRNSSGWTFQVLAPFFTWEVDWS